MNVTPEFVSAGLQRANYVTNERVETAIFLALALDKPLLIEGPAGSGKTEVAKVLAQMLGTELIRLQCYEGLDEARALYEWNYQKQLLRLQADEHCMRWEETSEHLFTREYLLERPLLRAIVSPRRVVLLIDEIDKADEEFEAFLLELLSDFQVTVPELGTLPRPRMPGSGAYFEPRARTVGGAAPPLPASVHRFSRPRTGASYNRAQASGTRFAASSAGRAARQRAAQNGAQKTAIDR